MKTAVVTGGSGGIGAAAVRELARDFRVFSLDIAAGEPTDGVTHIDCDVASEAGVAEAVEKLRGCTRHIDVVIHLAGIYLMDSLIETDETKLKRIFDVNFFGPYRVNKALMPLLSAGSRVIIVTSELARLKPMPFNGIYSLTKTALDAYAHSLRLELGLIDIDVVTVRPGAFDTKLSGSAVPAMRAMSGRTEHYRTNTEKFAKYMELFAGRAHDPAVLARRLRRIAVCRRPRQIYTVRSGLLLRLFDLLPAGGQRAVIKAILK